MRQDPTSAEQLYRNKVRDTEYLRSEDIKCSPERNLREEKNSMKQGISHLPLQSLSTACWVLALCTIERSAQAQVTTPYPTKTVYQMKNIQPDVQSWGTVGGSEWNANVSQIVGRQAGGVVQDLVGESWESAYPAICTGSWAGGVPIQQFCFGPGSPLSLPRRWRSPHQYQLFL